LHARLQPGHTAIPAWPDADLLFPQEDPKQYRGPKYESQKNKG